MSEVLKISNLTKHYGALRAVDDVSLAVNAGEIVGLLGPNGAGKTTLINTIVTLERPQSGSIMIEGMNLKEKPRICKAITGFMPQEVINHGYFTVEEVLFYHSGYYGLLSNKKRIDFLMKKFALYEHRHKKILKLSGGMKRRLLLVKALVHDPKLLLLDEPTTGVDVQLRYDMWDVVRGLREEGKAILFTTHYIEEAEKLCDRVAIINKGRLVQQNETKKLIQELTSRKIHLTLKKDIPLSHPSLKKINGRKFEFHVHSSVDIGPLLQEISINWEDVLDIRIQEGTLEDVFKNVLKGEA